MYNTSPPEPRHASRWWMVPGLTVTLACLVGLFVGDVPAQAPTKKPPKEEVEDTAPPKAKTPAPQKDETPAGKGSKASPRARNAMQTELGREAERAPNIIVQQLFADLSFAHDDVNMPSGRVVHVHPIARFVGPGKPQFPGEIKTRRYTDDWYEGGDFAFRAGEIAGVVPYEQIALNQVDAFLKKNLPEREVDTAEAVRNRLETLRQAEKVLGSVLRFHDSARERGLRDDSEGWKGVAGKLQNRLRDIQLDVLKSLGDAGDWDEAFALSTRLAERYPKEEAVQTAIAQFILRHADHFLQQKNYAAVRQGLKLLEEQFPNLQITGSLRDKLISHAQSLFDEARRLENTDRLGAIARLHTARGIWPQLPGLREKLLQLENAQSALYVGVQDLPQDLSPLRAFTDSEKQAVELLFEGLVKPTFRPETGQRFDPALADEAPQLGLHGRVFRLNRHAYWSNGQRVTASDVARTVGLLKEPRRPGYIAEWADLVEGYKIEGDQFHIRLTLSQGYLEPLSLMAFKVLPPEADDPRFSGRPVGSGPYVYDGNKGGQAVFLANPHYGERPGKSGLPSIRKLVFFHSDDPVSDFKNGRLHLLLDLPTPLYKQLQNAGFRAETMRNRRVYFLAVNHRKQNLASPELRRAVAHAIDRDKILDACFRADPGEFHRPLNGPYPPDSWAYDPKAAPAKVFDASRAKALADKAKAAGAKLTLKYPDGDAQVKQACQMIRDQVQQNAGIDLELVPVPVRQLRHDVMDLHEYELAYFYHDYPSEAYWLWPLFDPRGVGADGQNFLGYRNDAQLESLFRQAMVHRDPTVVKALTHDIHREIYGKMPLIPLWQLDSHFVYTSQLKPVNLDPLLVFTDVEKWTKDADGGRGQPAGGGRDR